MKIGHLFIFLLIFVVIIGCTPGSNGVSYDDRYFPLPDHPVELVRSEVQDFYVQPVVDGLQFPWGMVFLPDGSMLVTERAGTLRLIRDGELLEEPVEGVPDVRVGGSSGLMDIALHPDYKENGWIYMTYSALEGERAHNTALMRVRLEGNTLADHEILFKGYPMTEVPSHSGSRIVFRDGYVYFSIGDRGTMEWAQDLTLHAGSILRLHEDGEVPADNPFVDVENAQPEIFTYGHRNPQGLAFHPETGMLWSVEHGPKGGDELNIIEAGENYGWPVISASGIADDGTLITELTEKEGMRSFVYEWTPALAPSSMSFVNSDLYPGWKSSLLIGGLAGMRMVRLELAGDVVIHEENLLEGIGRIRNVVVGPDQFIYIAVDSSGEILRLVPAELF